MAKYSLSVCLITKNESLNIERCLNSIKDIADEIVVLDTGSEDNTIEIAKKFKANVFEMEWPNDFAKARNQCLDYATKDWILFLDADEELYKEDRELINELLKNDQAEAYLCQIYNFIGNDNSPEDFQIMISIKLFKNRTEYRYNGILHEQIGDSIYKYSDSNKIFNSKIRILHYGYLNAAISDKDKKRRNLSLAKKAVKENPNDPYILYYLGLEYERINKYENALEEFKKAKKLIDHKSMWHSKLYKEIIRSLIYLRNWEEAKKIVLEAEKLWVDYTDLFYLAGVIEYETGNYIKAIGCFTQCKILGIPQTPPYVSTEQGLANYKADYAIGLAYKGLNKIDDAINSFSTAFLYNRNWKQPLIEMTNVLFEKKDIEKAKLYLEKFFNLNNYNDLITLADLTAHVEEYNLALEYLTQAEKNNTSGIQILYLQGYCLTKIGKYKEAVFCLQKIEEQSPYYKDACLLLSFCYLNLDKLIEAKNIMNKIKVADKEYNILANFFIEEAKNLLKRGIKQFPQATILVDKLKELESGDLS